MGSEADSSTVAALLLPQMTPGNSHQLWKHGPRTGLTGPQGISLSLQMWFSLLARLAWLVQYTGIGRLCLVLVEHLPFPSCGSHPLQAGCKWD